MGECGEGGKGGERGAVPMVVGVVALMWWVGACLMCGYVWCVGGGVCNVVLVIWCGVFAVIYVVWCVWCGVSVVVCVVTSSEIVDQPNWVVSFHMPLAVFGTLPGLRY